MDFYEVLDQVIDLLQKRKRASYRALAMQFNLDDASLEVLKEELIEVHQLATDLDDKTLVWAGETEGTPVSTSQPIQVSEQPVPELIQPAQIEPPTPDAERRQLTVMFCDLADSTRLSVQLDPEDLRDVIRAYQSTTAEGIERYDGYIAQHLGDGLMVYFGWPQAHEDDAQRAVHAGLGILEAMGGLNARLAREKGIRLAMRIGIHTGLVVVGEIGSGASLEHLALGETPNIASRIEGIAEPDSVAISDTTYQLVQGYFVCEDLGQHMLRGVDEPQHVYQAVKESDAQSRLDVAAARGLTPLVGRVSETTMLFERWEQVKEGQGQVLLLSGEAGIGKSRLLQVLRDHVADEPHTRLECRSSPYYQNTALYPITGMLQRLFQWQQDDTPEAKLDKLEQTICQYRVELNEAMPLFANLLSLTIPEDRYPSLNISPQQQRQKILAMIMAMLLQQAEQQPVLFIVEDLHWTDASTLELLDLLIDQTPTAAICVLLTCRPTFQPTWSSRSYLTPIVLNRLSRSQIESMAERVVGGKRLPGEVMQQIVEKTDGVPLFVEEMTKAVLESGTLKEVNGQYEAVNTLSSLTIPTTLQDSLMARLDRLVTAKAVAQYAAVIGRQFSYALLHAVSQLNERTLQEELQRLVKAELLYQRGLPPQATYTFKHALIQDAAYRSLLKSTRQQYHQRIAQVLEVQFPETVETQPELLAHHYIESAQDKVAIRYWQQAGQIARQRSANLEAIGHLTHALDALYTLPETPDRVRLELDLQVALANPLMATKGWASPEVERVHKRSRHLCQQVGATEQVFPVLYGLCAMNYVRLQLPQALEIAGEFIQLAEQQHDPVPRLVAHRVMGSVLMIRGENSEARQHLEQSVMLHEPQQHREMAMLYAQEPGIAALSFLAEVLWVQGYPEQAVARSHRALALARDASHPLTLAYALRNAFSLRLKRGEEQVAWELIQEFSALSAEHGFESYLAIARFAESLMLAIEGHYKVGIAKIRQDLEVQRQLGLEGLSIQNLCLIVEVFRKLGQVVDGLLEVLEEALAVSVCTEMGQNEAELHRLKGELLLKLSSGQRAEAESCFQKAISIAQRQQAKSWELRAATSLARLWQSQGKRQEAYDLLEPVYAWFTEGFDTADLKEAKALLHELAE